MCLLTKQLVPEIAKENIRVWKVLDKKGHPYVIGKEYKYKPGFNYPLSDDEEAYGFEGSEYRYIGGGYLHAFTHVISKYDEETYDVVPMYIPKGTGYYTSASGSEMCAKCLYMPHKHKKLRAFFGLKEAIEI